VRRILAGVETEYGLYVEGHGAEEQIEDARALVRSYPGGGFIGWKDRHEAPRPDLRGFRLDRLAVDPEDLKFDVSRPARADDDVRSDRVLPNGARFYNDHGHPEYATPECWSLSELARHDTAGEGVVLAAAKAFAASEGLDVKVYKNNTDFHGASYGTHESYCVPRALGYERLFKAVTPMLVARQILTGAGKVGSESGRDCPYQISQRADFFAEPANAETLYRRPVFNTRDEPHARPEEWIRLHVISCDANMISSSTARRVGLVKLAIALEEIGQAPTWTLKDPVESFKSISRDDRFAFEVPLAKASWTNAYEILESYFAAAERFLDLDAEFTELIKECRTLSEALRSNDPIFKRSVDWAAKRAILESFMAEEGLDWRDGSLRAYDLEYHNVDPEEGLHAALEQMEEVVPNPASDLRNGEPTRALARGIAVNRFRNEIETICWRSIVFRTASGPEEVELFPDREYGPELAQADSVGSFITMLRGKP